MSWVVPSCEVRALEAEAREAMSTLIPEDIVAGLRHHGYMILPFEPNVADIAAMSGAMPDPACRVATEVVYAALANRHRGVPEVDKPSQPSRVDKDID